MKSQSSARPESYFRHPRQIGAAHGVRSCLKDAKSGDLPKARTLSNPEVAPHLSFADIGGHGYATVRVTSDAFATEFVCIPRPLDRSPRADGGPINYRVSHHAKLLRKR